MPQRIKNPTRWGPSPLSVAMAGSGVVAQGSLQPNSVVPEVGYEVFGDFVEGGTITVTKSGGGFGTRPAGFPTPIHYDAVDEWFNNGAETTPNTALAVGDPLPNIEPFPYGNVTNIFIADDITLPWRSRSYKTAVDGTWDDLVVDDYRAWPTTRTVNTGVVYMRFWVYFGPEFMNLLYSAPEKYTRIWEPRSATEEDNIRITLGMATYFSSNNAGSIANPGETITLGRSQETAWPSRGSEYGTAYNSPRTVGWNLIEHYIYMDGNEANSIASSRINGVVSGYREGGIFWRNWPLPNGAVPRGSIWDGNNANLEPYGARTGGAFGLLGPDKYIVASDIYSDLTPQRMEISDTAELYTLNAQRRLPYVTSWSDTQITMKISGAPAPGDRLFWVDANDVPHRVCLFVENVSVTGSGTQTVSLSVASTGSGTAALVTQAQGFDPQANITVTGSFVDEGVITITDVSNGFGTTGPTLLYYDDYTTVPVGGDSLMAGRLGVAYSTGGDPKPVHAVGPMPYGRGLAVGSTGVTQNATDAGRLYIRPNDNQPYSEFFEFKVSYFPEAHIANAQPYLDGNCTWQIKGIWHYFDSGFNTIDNDIFVTSGAPSWSAGNLYWMNVQITGSNDPPISSGSTNGYTVQTTDAPERAPIPGPRTTEAWFKAAPFGQQPTGSDGMFRQTDTSLGLQVNRDYADTGYFTATSAPNNQWDRCTITGFDRGFLVNEQCNIYYGQVYIAIGPGCPARVVITDSADYDAALKLSICTVDSWSAGTVTAKIRTGFFHQEGLAGKHLHLFDANNNGRYLGQFTDPQQVTGTGAQSVSLSVASSGVGASVVNPAAGDVVPALTVEYVDTSGVRQTTPVVDGVTTITGTAPFLVQFDASGTRAPAAFAAQSAITDGTFGSAEEAYAFLMVGYRINYGESRGTTWQWPTGANYSQDEDTGPPLFGRVFKTPGSYVTQLRVRDALNNEQTISCNVVVNAPPAATHIPVSQGSWPSWASNVRYTLQAGGDYRSFGQMSFGANHNIIIEKTGSGDDPRIGTFAPDGREHWTASVPNEPRAAHIRLVNIDAERLSDSTRGFDYCGIIGGRMRQYAAAAHEANVNVNNGTETFNTNLRWLRGLFLEDAEATNEFVSSSGFIMIGNYRGLHCRNVNFVGVANGSTTWLMLRTYGSYFTFRNNRWFLAIDGGTSNGTTLSMLSIGGVGETVWRDDDKVAPISSPQYGYICDKQIAQHNQYYDAGSFLTNGIVSTGGNPSPDYLVRPRLVGWEDNVWYPSGDVSLGLGTRLGGNYVFWRNSRRDMGAGSAIPGLTYAPNQHESANDPVYFNGPYLIEDTNTRPVPTAF